MTDDNKKVLSLGGKPKLELKKSVSADASELALVRSSKASRMGGRKLSRLRLSARVAAKRRRPKRLPLLQRVSNKWSRGRKQERRSISVVAAAQPAR